MAAGNNDWVDRNKMEEATRYLMNMLRTQPNPAQPNQAQLNQAQPEAAEVKRHLMTLVIGLTQVIPPHEGLDFNQLIGIIESIEGEHLAAAFRQMRRTSFLEGNANQVVEQIQNFLNGAEFQNALNANGAEVQPMPVQQIGRAEEILYSILTNLCNVMLRFGLDSDQRGQLRYKAVMDVHGYMSDYKAYPEDLIGMIFFAVVAISLIVISSAMWIFDFSLRSDHDLSAPYFRYARAGRTSLEYDLFIHDYIESHRKSDICLFSILSFVVFIIVSIIGYFSFFSRYRLNGNRSVADRLREDFVDKSRYPLLYDRSQSPKINLELIEKLATLLTPIRQYIEKRPGRPEREDFSDRMSVQRHFNRRYLDADFIESLESIVSVLKELLAQGRCTKRAKNS